jgi:hypothetical protein
MYNHTNNTEIEQLMIRIQSLCYTAFLSFPPVMRNWYQYHTNFRQFFHSFFLFKPSDLDLLYYNIQKSICLTVYTLGPWTWQRPVSLRTCWTWSEKWPVAGLPKLTNAFFCYILFQLFLKGPTFSLKQKWKTVERDFE